MKKRDIIILLIVFAAAATSVAYIAFTKAGDKQNTSLTRPASERNILYIQLEVRAPNSTASLSASGDGMILYIWNLASDI